MWSCVSPTSVGGSGPSSGSGWQCWAPLFPAQRVAAAIQQSQRQDQGVQTVAKPVASPVAASPANVSEAGPSQNSSKVPTPTGPQRLGVDVPELEEAGSAEASLQGYPNGLGPDLTTVGEKGPPPTPVGSSKPLMSLRLDGVEEEESYENASKLKLTKQKFLGVFSREQFVGLVIGCLLFLVLLCVELDEAFPQANDMLAVLGLVGTFWVFEVLPLPVTSLLPVVLLPYADIMSSKTASASYWSWVQMLFLGAFIVDIAIQQVDLHRRVALKFLLCVDVRRAWIVMAAFSCISYFMSMWCTNTATTVMLTPFAEGLLDTAQAVGTGSEGVRMQRRYSVGVLLAIAYSATCGGIATSIGTIPNGVVAGMPEVNGRVSAQDWFLFAFPVSFLGVLVAVTVVYLLYVRGVTLQMDREVLKAQYDALGKINRDEVVVCCVQLLQIVGWLFRKQLINEGMGLKGVNDATIACMGAALLFFIPSVKQKGEAILSWETAQHKLEWGVLLLMGGGFAIAKGFQDSNLTRFIGEKLAAASESMSMMGLTYLLTFVVCFLTEVTSNTATANVMLPIMGSVATETLTHPLALMLPTTVACSFAFMLPAATPPNSVIFTTGRVRISEFVRAGLVINLVMILLGAPLLYLLSNAVYDTNGPFPDWACLPRACRWVDVPGVVAGERVRSQACALLGSNACRLWDGTVLPINGTGLA